MAIYPQLQLDLLVQRLITAPWVQFDVGMRDQLPVEGGIYRIRDRSTDPPREIYVGISRHLKKRIYANHFTGTADNSTLTRKLINCGHYENADAVHKFLGASCGVQLLIIADERLRCFAEHYAVAILQPPHND